MAISTPLQGKTKTPVKRTPTISGGKAKGKPNGNIMSFFKKADSSGLSGDFMKVEDEPLFLADSPVKGGAETPFQIPTPPRDEFSVGLSFKSVEMGVIDSPVPRYNEETVPIKRRRTNNPLRQSPPVEEAEATQTRGPFVDDSDSDDEPLKIPVFLATGVACHESGSEVVSRDIERCIESEPLEKDPIAQAAPCLQREATSIGENNDFDGIEDFIDDEFPEEGEEYLERRWMEKQAEFEEGLEEGQAVEGDTIDVELRDLGATTSITQQDAGSSACPICGGNTAGLSDQV